MTDNGGARSGFGQSNRNFESDTVIGQTVNWNIVPTGDSAEDYEVSLVSITHNTGSSPEIFPYNPMVVNHVGIVSGTVNVREVPENDEEYSINFLLTLKDDPSITYPLTIDPKLKVNPRE